MSAACHDSSIVVFVRIVIGREAVSLGAESCNTT
jgi:hypothetical protein